MLHLLKLMHEKKKNHKSPTKLESKILTNECGNQLSFCCNERCIEHESCNNFDNILSKVDKV